MTWPENVISLTEPEFAQLVNVSRRTIARERQAGRLPFSEIGPRDLRYTRTDLETY
ncbi:MAG: helix-turn-helix domain-containing protein [Blastocatellia bacterium]